MHDYRKLLAGGLILACLPLVGCKPKEPPAPESPAVAPLAAAPHATAQPMQTLPPGHPPIDGAQAAESPNSALPPGHPPIEGAEAAGAPPTNMNIALKTTAGLTMLDEAPTRFAGLTLTPPLGWQAFDPGGSPMAPVAAFLLEAAPGEELPTNARLTHFPGMKDIPLEMNLNRWYGMVIQPDGKATKDVAKLETFDTGGAHVTVVDMTGTIEGDENQRMIAAVIEHPQGPHFLKVVGPSATMAKWRDSVFEYLQSAKVEE